MCIYIYVYVCAYVFRYEANDSMALKKPYNLN